MPGFVLQEGKGNPLQCSCLENPRDGGAWWAAVYEVAKSRTQLKRLSSSSSRLFKSFEVTVLIRPFTNKDSEPRDGTKKRCIEA